MITQLYNDATHVSEMALHRAYESYHKIDGHALRRAPISGPSFNWRLICAWDINETINRKLLSTLGRSHTVRRCLDFGGMLLLQKTSYK